MMSQIVPDIDNISMSLDDDEEENYSSIDDLPRPIVNDDKSISQSLMRFQQSLQQKSLSFHIGSTVTTKPKFKPKCEPKVEPKFEPKVEPKVTSPLPDLVPTTERSPRNFDSLFELSSSEDSPPWTVPDQQVPNQFVFNKFVYDQNVSDLDQLVPDYCGPDQFGFDLSTSKSWVISDKHLLNNINSDQSLYFPTGYYGPPVTQPQQVYSPIEWRSTKLSADNLECLGKALLCFSLRCCDEDCEKGKYLLDNLKMKIQQRHVIDCEDRKILEYLLDHHQDCNELFCISPGCYQLEKCIDSLGDLIDCITKDYEHQFTYSQNATFYRFSDNCCAKSLEDVDEKIMYSLASPNSLIIYLGGPPKKKWEKLTVLGDIMQDILPVLLKIGELSNHPYILPIDWLCDDNIIYYSSEHFAEPLKDRIDIIDKRRRNIILQLIDAALFLNANGVAFLAWTTENICYKNGQVKLTNFHLGSALINDFEPGMIKCLLFPTIVPPELHTEDPTLEKTKADVWGVCCLLYELLTKKVVHSHLLHMERCEVWRKLDEDGWIPKYPLGDLQLQKIFKKGWKVEPQDRCSLDTLRSLIADCRNDF